jgi:lactate racemase
MIASVPYGKTAIELPDRVAASARILQPPFPGNDVNDADILELFRRAITGPIGCHGLADIAAGRKSACIVVSDRTRSYGVGVWLPALLDLLNSAGLPDDRITVLFATGAHGAQLRAAREMIAGARASRRVRLVDHDCDDAEGLVELGRTAAGTPVSINRLAVEADLLIATGIVMPHYYAGFTGGRKSIMPGVAARETIYANHSLNLAPGGGTHPCARPAVLKGNPIHEDFLDALRFVRVDFSIQVVPDGHGRPGAFFAGDVLASHEAARALASEWFCVPVEKRVPWAIASCGGHPKDIDFYQSHKSLDNAFRAVVPGGAILLIAECPEGLGPPEFEKWFEAGGPAEIEAKLRKKYEVAGHTALRTIEKAGQARVFLLSALPRDAVRKMGIIPVDGIDDAIREIGLSRGEGLIMPHAALTVPVVRE